MDNAIESEVDGDIVWKAHSRCRTAGAEVSQTDRGGRCQFCTKCRRSRDTFPYQLSTARSWGMLKKRAWQ